ncbi:MAG: hypothetical protein EA349_06975 [Halomonadaceae bacterium]|nr:MAG: hypothetical protein EA349_06975 [Halomonadaceae bacterium]
MFPKGLVICLALMWLTACAHTGQAPDSGGAVPVAGQAVDMSDLDQVKKSLLAQHGEWQGTRYRLGGLTKQGVDCSGFVYQTFRSRLGQELPRTTELQSQLGRSVAERERQVGDLVFFRTGLKKRHVGIYLGGDEFLHASTSQGVTISSMNNPYWQSSYWHSRRVAGL